MEEIEIWKDVVGYEGLYQVSNLGKVRSLDRVVKRGWCYKGKLLTPTVNKDNGYLYVNLAGKNKTVHRLVALAFIPNPENKPCVGHKDTNRQNAKASNLEWVTYSENNHNPITLKRNSESTTIRMKNESVRRTISNSVKKKYVEDKSYRDRVRNATIQAMKRPEILEKISKEVEKLLDGVVVERYSSIKSAAKKNGVHYCTISKWCNGLGSKGKPYEWRFA